MTDPISDEKLVERFARHSARPRQCRPLPRPARPRACCINRCARLRHVAPPAASRSARLLVDGRRRATAVSGRGTIHLAIFLHQGPPADGRRLRDAVPGRHRRARRAGRACASRARSSTPRTTTIAIGAPVELDWIDRDGRAGPRVPPRGGDPRDLARETRRRTRSRSPSAATTGFSPHDSGERQPGVARRSRRASPCCATAGSTAADVDGIVRLDARGAVRAVGARHPRGHAGSPTRRSRS